MENIIDIRRLSKSFGEVRAVDDLSFKVKKGELFAFWAKMAQENRPPFHYVRHT